MIAQQANEYIDAPYKCPRCGNLPHWYAVVIAGAAFPVHPHVEMDRERKRTLYRPAVLAISAEICRGDGTDQGALDAAAR